MTWHVCDLRQLRDFTKCQVITYVDKAFKQGNRDLGIVAQGVQNSYAIMLGQQVHPFVSNSFKWFQIRN